MKKPLGILIMAGVLGTTLLTSCHKISLNGSKKEVRKHRTYIEVKREELTNSLKETEQELTRLLENTSENNGGSLISFENELNLILKKIDKSTAENIDELKEKALRLHNEIKKEQIQLMAIK